MLSLLLVLSAPASAEGVTQLQLDVFDYLSPGWSLWVNHMRLDDAGAPRWQAFVAGGQFDHYDPGELAAYGWGDAAERRRFVRLGAHRYLWRGLFAGAHAEAMARLITSHQSGAQQTAFMPTLQPSLGYSANPWGLERGRFGVMVYVAPRVPLVRADVAFEDTGEVYVTPRPVEFASGLNLTLTL